MGTLTIRQGKREQLTVTADPAILPQLTTQVQGGLLTIGARGAFGTHQPITYDLTIKDAQSIADTSSGRIVGGPLRLRQLHLVAQGSGDIQLAGQTVPPLQVTLAGAGRCMLSGTVSQSAVFRICRMASWLVLWANMSQPKLPPATSRTAVSYRVVASNRVQGRRRRAVTNRAERRF